VETRSSGIVTGVTDERNVFAVILPLFLPVLYVFFDSLCFNVFLGVRLLLLVARHTHTHTHTYTHIDTPF